MAEITGSCRCGKVTYATSADPVFVGICHCRKCQQSTGTAYGAVVGVPTASLTVHGTTKRFDDVGDSGQATHRDFCPDCGSPIKLSADIAADVTMITVGTLDEPTLFKPAMQIYCDSAMPWAQIAEMKSFAKMPG